MARLPDFNGIHATGDDFTVTLPLHDVPDGDNIIEVIGIAEDGVQYPVESLNVTIHNEPWKQRLFHTLEYQRIEENLSAIRELWQQVKYWLEHATAL